MIDAVPNLIEIDYYCSNAGYGIHSTEIILYEFLTNKYICSLHIFSRLWSAMKRLNNEIHCKEMKFWGKIFGLNCDYYIVQVRLIYIPIRK